jgi:uncharacterized protein YjbI with pentapeptide repeats
MNPQVDAALIAGAVSLISLAGTVAVAIVGFRTTTKVTDKAIGAQREQLTEARTRTLNERFATAADQLGSDKSQAVRLAGVHAMAGLADDWEENRQTCIDVLCAYLRLPYEPDPGEQAPAARQLEFRASREVRHTVIRVITAHLRPDAKVSWRGLNFDFTGTVFDGGDFRFAEFSGGTVSFSGAEFSGGEVHFDPARFSDGIVSFSGAKFSGGTVTFGADDSALRKVAFTSVGDTTFPTSAEFSGAVVIYSRAEFSGGTVNFKGAVFYSGAVAFPGAKFSGGMVNFNGANFSGDARVSVGGAEFSGGTVSFSEAEFSGRRVTFLGAKFSGGTVDFRRAEWSSPPMFDWDDTPPSGVMLPPQSRDSPS